MRDLMFVGIRGNALALDRATGQEVWRTSLKGADFVNVVRDGSEVFASARGQLFCLDAATGRLRWRNKLSGLGWGIVSIAGTCAAAAAESQRRQRESSS